VNFEDPEVLLLWGVTSFTSFFRGRERTHDHCCGPQVIATSVRAETQSLLWTLMGCYNNQAILVCSTDITIIVIHFFYFISSDCKARCVHYQQCWPVSKAFLFLLSHLWLRFHCLPRRFHSVIWLDAWIEIGRGCDRPHLYSRMISLVQRKAISSGPAGRKNCWQCHYDLSCCLPPPFSFSRTGTQVNDVKLFPEDSVELMVGEALTLNCTATVEFDTGVDIQWSYPGKQVLNRCWLKDCIL